MLEIALLCIFKLGPMILHASMYTPFCRPKRYRDSNPTVWCAVEDNSLSTLIIGLDGSGNGKVVFELNLSDFIGMDLTSVSSNIMVGLLHILIDTMCDEFGQTARFMYHRYLDIKKRSLHWCFRFMLLVIE